MDATELAAALEADVCPQHQRRYWEAPEGPWCPLCENDAPDLPDLLAMLRWPLDETAL